MENKVLKLPYLAHTHPPLNTTTCAHLMWDRPSLQDGWLFLGFLGPQEMLTGHRERKAQI